MLASLETQVERIQSTAETVNLSVGCLVLTNTETHKQTTDIQKQIRFIVFGSIQPFELLCLSPPKSSQVVCSLRACTIVLDDRCVCTHGAVFNQCKIKNCLKMINIRA